MSGNINCTKTFKYLIHNTSYSDNIYNFIVKSFLRFRICTCYDPNDLNLYT
jgi:hypothetical protein